jgi:hypothetical protein
MSTVINDVFGNNTGVAANQVKSQRPKPGLLASDCRYPTRLPLAL